MSSLDTLFAFPRGARTLLRTLILLFAAGTATQLSTHVTITTKLTWSREISRIVYRRCISCHREGGSTFSLTRYTEARPWATAIKEEVLGRRMPPWFAVKGFGTFKDDAGLTQEEIELLSEWVEGGAPEGDERLLPPLPELPKQIARAPKTQALAVPGVLKIRRELVIAGIRPVKLEKGASIRVIGERPNGMLEPLIWINEYNPRFPRAYYFEKPLKFPAGTTIRVNPARSVALLLTSARKRAE